MHYTFTPRINDALIVIEAALALGCYLTADNSSLPVWVGFATAGIFAGLLQGVALRRSSSELKSATSEFQVRAALMASIPSKASVLLLWVAVLTVAVMFFYGAMSATVPTMLGFYAVFALGREVAAFPTLLLGNRACCTAHLGWERMLRERKAGSPSPVTTARSCA